MKEGQPVQIKFIGESASGRDYCYIALDKNIRNDLTGILELEEILSGELSYRQREDAIVAHMRLWNRLPDYYKSELADLTAIDAYLRSTS